MASFQYNGDSRNGHGKHLTLQNIFIASNKTGLTYFSSLE